MAVLTTVGSMGSPARMVRGSPFAELGLSIAVSFCSSPRFPNYLSAAVPRPGPCQVDPIR
eukprot:444155-Hanusia_phi.AAC.1